MYYLSKLRTRSKSHAEASTHLLVVAEVDTVAAAREVIDMRPRDGNCGQRLKKGTVLHAAEAIAAIDAQAVRLGVQSFGEFNGRVRL